jgi:type IV pilus assembly protein PilV
MPMIPRNDSRPARARGFTLIEVLVALVVTGIGLLGIAKIQALVYANTGSAGVRSLVAIQASGLAAVMHANHTYWAGLAPSPLTITRTSTGTVLISDNTLNTTATGVSDCNSTGSTVPLPCTPALLAAYDLHTWANGINALLPGANPTTTITCQSIPVNCAIRITWNEKTVSLNAESATGTTGGSTGTFAPTYILYVEP